MPFLAGRGQASRGYFGGGTVPDAPTLGTIATSINSPGTVSKPVMTQDETNATFTWTSPGATGAALSVPFTAPTFNGGLPITNYEYSTDNGSTWKSAGSTTSPISITTVSGSSSNLSAATSYTVRLRAINPLGSGTSSSGSAKTTPTEVTSYTIKVYDNYPTNNELIETVELNTTGTLSRSHHKLERDWSVIVSAVNTNGAGPDSTESDNATGWRYTSYNADYARTRPCESGTDCDSCGTRTGTQDGTTARTCYQWTRSGSVTENGLACVLSVPGNEEASTTWGTNCRDLEASCSGSWSDVTAGGCYSEYAGYQCYTLRQDQTPYGYSGDLMSMDNDPTGEILHGSSCGSTAGGAYYAYYREYCAATGVYRIVPYGCIDTIFAK
jgi:hypothetical protein